MAILLRGDQGLVPFSRFWREDMSEMLCMVEPILDMTTTGKLGPRNQIFQKGLEPGEKERVDVTMIRDGRHKKRRRFGCKTKAMVTSPGPHTRDPAQTRNIDKHVQVPLSVKETNSRQTREGLTCLSF